ncbi:MAG: mechanosensitive ion channel domain-containing protein [Candidatus Firestonebacteria bacterium]
MEKIIEFLESIPIWIWFVICGVLIILIYKLVTKWIEKKLIKRKSFHAKFILTIWRIIFMAVIVITLLSNLGNIGTIGISAAFLGMLLGWGLQQPVTGLAAWLLIKWTEPFKSGDRIILAGIIGDVRSIGPMYITLEQVGGTIGGEEQSGRAILIPTALLFGQVVTNYRLDPKYKEDERKEEEGLILDEVPVRITFESDWDKAEKILIECATEVTNEIINKSSKAPFIRAEFLDWGVLIRLRYWSVPSQRQRISSEIVEKIFKRFSKEKDIEFAYPHTEIVYRPKNI